jgi:hypothetical protein
MILIGLLFYLTPPTLFWLAVHLVRFRTKKPLPRGLFYLVIAVVVLRILSIILLIESTHQHHG